MLKLYLLVIQLFAFLFVSNDLRSQRQKKEFKNLIFIVVDDMAWNDITIDGESDLLYETPNISEFANQAIRFDNAYSASPVCSPTRSALLTGMNPARIGITDWIPGSQAKNKPVVEPKIPLHLDLSYLTLAEILKNEGYKTFFAGKWHLGGEGFLPTDQGFDFNYGGNHTGQPAGGYYSPYKNPQLADGSDGEYLTDRLTTEAIQFMDEHKNDKFMVYLSYYTVHTPIQGNKEYDAYFEDKANAMEWSDKLWVNRQGGLTRVNQDNPKYAAMLKSLDVNLGRVFQYLKAQDLFEQSMIVFTSDNGGLSTLDEAYKRGGPTSVLPLRGGKGWIYEGGIKVPLLIYDENLSSAQPVQQDIVVSQDLLPTVLKGLNIDSADKLDGIAIDFSESSARNEAIWYYPHYHGSGWKPGMGIRVGDWKLIYFFETQTSELYDLKKDPFEENDCSESYPFLKNQLFDQLNAKLDQMGAQKPHLSN